MPAKKPTANSETNKPKKVASKAAVASPPTQTIEPLSIEPLATANIITTAEAGAEDLQEKVEALSRKLDTAVKDQHNEQRNIIIGVLIAVVLIVATVAGEVIIFNASFNSSLDASQAQSKEDYRDLREMVDQHMISKDEQLLELLKSERSTSQVSGQ